MKRSERILVVVRNGSLLTPVKEFLEEHCPSDEIVYCSSPEEGFKNASNDFPSLIITELFPDSVVTGNAIIRRAKRFKPSAQACVVSTSEESSFWAVIDIAREGCFGYVKLDNRFSENLEEAVSRLKAEYKRLEGDGGDFDLDFSMFEGYDPNSPPATIEEVRAILAKMPSINELRESGQL